MKIIAKKNNIKDLPEDLQGNAFNQIANGDGSISLTLEKEYTVGGVLKNGDHEFYLIVYDADEAKGYPWWYPSEIFEVSDVEYPSDWITVKRPDGSELTTFPELAHDDGTLQNDLEDGEPSAIRTFLKYYNQYCIES